VLRNRPTAAVHVQCDPAARRESVSRTCVATRETAESGDTELSNESIQHGSAVREVPLRSANSSIDLRTKDEARLGGQGCNEILHGLRALGITVVFRDQVRQTKSTAVS